VIKEEDSWKNESYTIKNSNENLSLEYPQYTRPKKIENYEVPEVLLN
jgi:tRNA G37 N-methylase TrmD